MSTLTQITTAVTGNTITAAVWNDEWAQMYGDYNGGITNANISGSAAIATSKLADGALDTGITVADANAASGADFMISGIEFVIDGSGGTISTGVAGDLEIPFDCTINRVSMMADQSGSAVVDIWKDTWGNFPPTNADSITASAVPTITSATNSQDTTLTGWTTTISAGDVLRYNVDSATTITRLTVSLKVTKT